MTNAVTKYLPSDWLEEIVPTPQENPESFLKQDDAGWHLVDPEGPDEDGGDYFWITPVKPGDVIRFFANRVFGDFVLTVRPDGTFTTDRPIPDEANFFRLEKDNDSISHQIEDLIENYELNPGQHDIDAYWWSDEEYLFKFEIIDGEAKLIASGVRQ